MTDAQMVIVLGTVAAGFVIILMVYKGIVAPLGRLVADTVIKPAAQRHHQRKMAEAVLELKKREQPLVAAPRTTDLVAKHDRRRQLAGHAIRVGSRLVMSLVVLPMMAVRWVSRMAHRLARKTPALKKAWAKKRSARRWQKLGQLRGKPDRKAPYQRALQKLPLAEFQDRQLYVGNKIRVATTYRIFVDGEWQSVTWVAEPISNKSYWLAGSPQEDPQIEGFLTDRKSLPLQSQAVH